MTTETLQFMVLANTAQLDAMTGKIAAMNATLAGSGAAGTVGAAAKGGSALQRFGGKAAALSPIGRGAKIVAVGMGLIGAVSFKAAADFDQSMRIFQSAVGATTEEMKPAREEAIRLGNDIKLPGVTAKDAADAMTEMAKGGFDLAESQAAARDVLMLGQAAQMDYADSATIVARSLKAFNIPATRATEVVDALAAGEIKSTANMQSLADGMAYVSTTAAGLSVNFVDTTTGLAMLNDAGVAGTKAGTSLNQMLQRMTPSSEKAKDSMKELGLWTKKGGSAFFDAKGEYIGMDKAAVVMTKSLKGVSKEKRLEALHTIFGTQGQRAANVVLGQGKKKWDDYQTAISETGNAQKLAAARAQGAKGATEAFKNAASTAGIALGTSLGPAIIMILRLLTKMFAWFAKHPKIMTAVVVAILAIAAAFWLLSAAASVALTVAALAAAELLVPLLVGAGIALAVVAAIALIGVALYLLWTRSETFRKIVTAAWEAVKDAALDAFEYAKEAIARFVDYLTGVLMPTIQEVRDFITAWTPVWKAAWTVIQAAVQVAVQFIKGYIDVLKGVFMIWFAVMKFIVMNWIAIVKMIFQVVAGVVRLVAALLQGDWAAAWDAAKGIVRTMVTFVKTMLTNLWNLVKSVFSGIGSILRGALRGPAAVLKAILNAIVGAFKAAWGAVKSGVSSAVGAIKSKLGQLVSFIGGIPGKAAAKLGELGTKLYNKAKEGISRLDDLVGTAAAAAVRIGKAIVDGAISGISGLAEAIADKVGGAVRSGLSKVNPFSPIEVGAARLIGVPIIVGAVAGIKKAAPQLVRALNAEINKAARSVNVDAFSELVQHAFEGIQSAQMTPAEAKIAGIERQQQVDQLTTALAEATRSGDAAAIAKAKQDIELFNLREQAEKERRILDERQWRQSRALTAELEKLRRAFEKQSGKEGKEKKGVLTAGEKAVLRRQANRIKNRFGGPGGRLGAVNAPVAATVAGGAVPVPTTPGVAVGTINVSSDVDVDRMLAGLSTAVAVQS